MYKVIAMCKWLSFVYFYFCLFTFTKCRKNDSIKKFVRRFCKSKNLTASKTNQCVSHCFYCFPYFLRTCHLCIEYIDRKFTHTRRHFYGHASQLPHIISDFNVCFSVFFLFSHKFQVQSPWCRLQFTQFHKISVDKSQFTLNDIRTQRFNNQNEDE